MFSLCETSSSKTPGDCVRAEREINQSNGEWVESAETVGAFLNLRVNVKTLSKYILSSVADHSMFTLPSTQHENKKVMIEYSQPNTPRYSMLDICETLPWVTVSVDYTSTVDIPL